MPLPPVPTSLLGRFLVVRPHDERFRERVFGVLREADYDTENFTAAPPGTPDVVCADAIRAAADEIDLLLIPFHQHKDENGASVDGIGALVLVNEDIIAKIPLILMPVTDFAAVGAFPRRHEELDSRHPHIMKKLFPLMSVHFRRGAERAALVESLRPPRVSALLRDLRVNNDDNSALEDIGTPRTTS